MRPKLYSRVATWRAAPQMTVLLRASNGDPASLAPALRAAVRAIDPTQPLYNVMPLADIQRSRFARERFMATLMNVFSVAALLIAALGVFASMSCAGALRRREIGIRLALGASRGSVLRTISWSGAKLVGIGIEAGLVLSVAVVAVLQASLFASGHIDVLTTVAAVSLVIVVAAGALLIPAVRATRVDPLDVLRHE